MSADEKIYYSRQPLPADGQWWDANTVVTANALDEVLQLMQQDGGVDPTRGEFRIYYPLDSQLQRTWVTAEWRPNK